MLVFHEDDYYWQNLSNGELELNVQAGDGYFVIAPSSNDGVFVENGNHYARKAPTATQGGVKEYYVSCDDHEHYVLEDGKMYFRGVHYSNSSAIQVIIANYTSTFNNGNNFLANDSGFNINQTDSTVSQAGWFSQGFVEGKYRLLTACFANAAVDGQIWVIKANSLLTDSDGKEYLVDKDYRFTYSAGSSSWTMNTESMIPNGNWAYNTSLVAPNVDMEDNRYIAPDVPTFDISTASTGYTTNSVIQINCDLDLGSGIYTDGGVMDITDVRVYKNDVLTSLNSIQYFHTEGGTSLLSMNLGSAAATDAGDILHFVAGSIFKITLNEVTYLRELEKDTYFIYDGSKWVRCLGANLTVLPVSGNVEYNMIYINCGPMFGVASDTSAYFTGTMKLNDVALTSYSVTAASGGGFFISGIGTLKDTSFTFSISKNSTVTANGVTALLLSDYNVRFDGSVFSWN